MKNATRYNQADALTKRLIEACMDRAMTMYSLNDRGQAAHFTCGYLASQLASLASLSPTAMRELEAAVKFAEGNK